MDAAYQNPTTASNLPPGLARGRAQARAREACAFHPRTIAAGWPGMGCGRQSSPDSCWIRCLPTVTSVSNGLPSDGP